MHIIRSLLKVANNFIEHRISIKELYFSLSFWFITLVTFLGFTTRFQTSLLLANLLIALVIYFVVVLVTNRLLLSAVLTLLLAVSFDYVKELKWQFLMQGLSASDFFMLRLLINHGLLRLIYEYSTTEIYLVFILLVVNFVLLWSKYDTLLDRTKLDTKNYYALRLLSIGVSILLTSKLIDLSLDKSSYLHKMIEHKGNEKLLQSNRSYGPFADVLFTLPNMQVEPKKTAVDENFVLSFAKQEKSEDGPISNMEDMPDIVVILNESTFDPSKLDYDFADKFNYKFFQANKYTKYSGILSVNTFGGSSWISEYEVNTGIPHKSFFGPGYMPFITLTPITMTSIMTHLKSIGYQVDVIYPVDKNFSLANDAYRQIGADSVEDVYEFGYKPESWQNIPDRIIGDMIIKKLDQDPKKPKYIFAATMINHGPHSKFMQDNIGCSQSMNDFLCSKLNDYMKRLALTNKDQSELIEKLMQRKKKTIVVNFGDHLPSFEGYSTQLRFKREIKDYYKTFYNINANFGVKEQVGNYPVLEISFIPSLILDIAGLNSHDFYIASSFMRKKCNGQLKECAKETKNDLDLLDSYQSIVNKQMNF